MKPSQLTVIVSCFLAVALTACKAKPVAHKADLRVSPDASLRDQAPLHVHIIGVQDDPQQLDRYRNKSLTEWFGHRDALRESSTYKEMIFQRDSFGPQVLTRNDPVWGQWMGRGVMHLVVFANTGAPRGQVTPATDPRKQFIPLDSRHWSGVREITVEIREGQITVVPSPKPLPK
jgi:hypothetical protein